MLLTVLTPCYNRAELLERAYRSLRQQTDTDFEWLIVDDGSTDDTPRRVQAFQKEENSFPVRYVRQENGGKHRALNRGVLLANAPYILILDNDDYLTPDAVSYIRTWTETIDGNEKIAAVYGLRGWQTRPSAVGGRPERDGFVDATYLERRKYDLMGDRAEIYKTEILKKYPFPEFEGENFLQESAVFVPIAQDGYQIRWFDRIIYKCEYLEGGLTRTNGLEKLARNFNGHLYCAKQYLQSEPFFYAALKIGQTAAIARKAGKTDRQLRSLLSIGRFRLWSGKVIYTLNQVRKKILKK